jgi:hypothetical protein
MILGRVSQGTIPYALAKDEKLVARVPVPRRVYLPVLRIYMDTMGSGGGSQVARPIVYDNFLTIVAAGDELTMPAGLPADWYDWGFSSVRDGAALVPAAGDYWMGLHAGASGGVIRMYA